MIIYPPPRAYFSHKPDEICRLVTLGYQAAAVAVCWLVPLSRSGTCTAHMRVSYFWENVRGKNLREEEQVFQQMNLLDADRKFIDFWVISLFTVNI
jgi:hypothetical protein